MQILDVLRSNSSYFSMCACPCRMKSSPVLVFWEVPYGHVGRGWQKEPRSTQARVSALNEGPTAVTGIWLVPAGSRRSLSRCGTASDHLGHSTWAGEVVP